MSGPRTTTEATLLAALRAGDAEAFRELVDRHHAMLVRLAGIWTSEGATEEVVQDTWLAVVEGLDRFEARSSLRTWIVSILVNKARSRARREGRAPETLAPTEAEAAEPPVPAARFSWVGRWRIAPGWWDDDTPERLVLAAETLHAIEGALAALPPGQRAVVTLRDVEGWAAAEVCNALAISETNQRVLLHRARSRLRAALEAHYGEGVVK